MKRSIALITAVFIAAVFSASPARADRKTMEGFLLGTGVAILGTAIIHNINKDHPAQYQGSYSRPAPYLHNEYRGRHRHRSAKRHAYRGPRGHWEVEKVWVEPVYEKKWNPGHYDHRGRWVEGRHEQFIVCEGYWKEEKVWVRH